MGLQRKHSDKMKEKTEQMNYNNTTLSLSHRMIFPDEKKPTVSFTHPCSIMYIKPCTFTQWVLLSSHLICFFFFP